MTTNRFALFHDSRPKTPVMAFENRSQLKTELSKVGITVNLEGLHGVVGEWMRFSYKSSWVLMVISEADFQSIGFHYTTRNLILTSVILNTCAPWDRLKDVHTTQECRQCFSIYEFPSIYTVCRRCARIDSPRRPFRSTSPPRRNRVEYKGRPKYCQKFDSWRPYDRDSRSRYNSR